MLIRVKVELCDCRNYFFLSLIYIYFFSIMGLMLLSISYTTVCCLVFIFSVTVLGAIADAVVSRSNAWHPDCSTKDLYIVIKYQFLKKLKYINLVLSRVLATEISTKYLNAKLFCFCSLVSCSNLHVIYCKCKF